MKEFLLCCFQKDPDQRWSSKDLQEHDWILKNQQRKKETTTTTTTSK
jgi:serine/threonine protein kinase